MRRALAPTWWKNVRRPPRRSTIASVNDVLADATRTRPVVSMPTARHAATTWSPWASSPTTPANATGKSAPSRARSTAMFRPGPPVPTETSSMIAMWSSGG